MTRTMYHTCFTPDPVFGQLLFWIPDLPLIGSHRIYSDTFFLLSHVIRNIHSFYGCWRSIYGISSLAWASYISLQQRIRLFCLSQVFCLLTGDSDVYCCILALVFPIYVFSIIITCAIIRRPLTIPLFMRPIYGQVGKKRSYISYSD